MRIAVSFLLLGALMAGGCAESAMSDNTPDIGAHQAAMQAAAAPESVASPPISSGKKVLLADADADPAAPLAHRSIIYQAGLSMVVPNIAAAEGEVQKQAEALGGFLQELDGPAISVRVPASKFNDLLPAIEKLGEVTQRHIKAADVTEQMRDLAIRLDNAEQVRKRLAEFIEKSPKMEDTLKIEQELERVTEAIELLKGKIQFLQSQVAMSTLRVEFNSPLPQKQAVVALPFSWVRELGDGVVTGASETSPDTSRLWKRNERFTLPPGFVRYFERDHITEAMSGDEVIIKLRREDNYDGGAVDFWKHLARRELVENRAIALTHESDAKLKDGTSARIFAGARDEGTQKQGYLLGIAATSRYVYTFEAWGEKDKLDAALPALEAAFETLDVKHW